MCEFRFAVVDNDDQARTGITQALELLVPRILEVSFFTAKGYEYDTVDAAIAGDALGCCDVLFLDYDLGSGKTAIDALEQLRRSYFDLPIVILTRYDIAEVIASCLHKGASAYLAKEALPGRNRASVLIFERLCSILTAFDQFQIGTPGLWTYGSVVRQGWRTWQKLDVKFKSFDESLATNNRGSIRWEIRSIFSMLLGGGSPLAFSGRIRDAVRKEGGEEEKKQANEKEAKELERRIIALSATLIIRCYRAVELTIYGKWYTVGQTNNLETKYSSKIEKLKDDMIINSNEYNILIELKGALGSWHLEHLSHTAYWDIDSGQPPSLKQAIDVFEKTMKALSILAGINPALNPANEIVLGDTPRVHIPELIDFNRGALSHEALQALGKTDLTIGWDKFCQKNPAYKPINNRKLLLIDDQVQDEFAKELIRILEGLGAAVTPLSPSDLYRYSASLINQQDLVIVDLHMDAGGTDIWQCDPKGIIVLRALQRLAWCIPVTILTADISAEHLVRCLSAGALDYMPKCLPVKNNINIVELLNERIVKILGFKDIIFEWVSIETEIRCIAGWKPNEKWADNEEKLKRTRLVPRQVSCALESAFRNFQQAMWSIAPDDKRPMYLPFQWVDTVLAPDGIIANTSASVNNLGEKVIPHWAEALVYLGMAIEPFTDLALQYRSSLAENRNMNDMLGAIIKSNGTCLTHAQQAYRFRSMAEHGKLTWDWTRNQNENQLLMNARDTATVKMQNALDAVKALMGIVDTWQ